MLRHVLVAGTVTLFCCQSVQAAQQQAKQPTKKEEPKKPEPRPFDDFQKLQRQYALKMFELAK
jgi:hypothetical protein